MITRHHPHPFPQELTTVRLAESVCYSCSARNIDSGYILLHCHGPRGKRCPSHCIQWQQSLISTWPHNALHTGVWCTWSLSYLYFIIVEQKLLLECQQFFTVSLKIQEELMIMGQPESYLPSNFSSSTHKPIQIVDLLQVLHSVLTSVQEGILLIFLQERRQ